MMLRFKYDMSSHIMAITVLNLVAALCAVSNSFLHYLHNANAWQENIFFENINSEAVINLWQSSTTGKY